MNFKKRVILTFLLFLTLASELSAGTEAVAVWETTEDSCAAEAMITHPAGGVLTTCTVTRADFSSEIRTVRYDAAGNRVWSSAFAGEPGVLNQARTLALAPNGDVLVSGTGRGPDGSFDILTIQYDSTGAEIRVMRWTGTGDEDRPADLRVDAAGNIYVAGTTRNLINTDIVLLKYDGAGNLLWQAVYDSGLDDAPAPFKQSLALDNAGNAYIAGEQTVLKYDEAGNRQWALPRAGSALVWDARGFLTHTSPAATARLNANGSVLWSVNQGGMHLAVNTHGDIWVAGPLIKSNGDWDFRVTRVDPAGHVLWSAEYDGGLDDAPADIAADDAGNVYVTGRSEARYGLFRVIRSDYLTVKYDDVGGRVWTARRDLGEGARAVVRDAAGFIYVTGLSGATVKYREAATSSCQWWQFWCW